MEKQKKNLGSVAFLPLIVFLVCYVGCGITFTLMGADDPFGKFPRHVALLAGCAVALLLNRSMDVKDKLNMLNSLIQKNIRYGVIIKDIHINMQTVPISGDILFTQTGYRARGSVARDISVNFTLYDVSRSRENSHGVKIESWDVRYSEPREITDEEKLK